MSEILHNQENREIKQKSPEKLRQEEENLVKSLKNYEIVKKQIQKEESISKQQDQKILEQIEDYLNWKTDKLEINWEQEQQLSEKEKILKYWKLSELSYIHLWADTKWELEITKVEIDPVLLANIDKIFDEKNPENLSPQEEFLYNYVHNKEN